MLGPRDLFPLALLPPLLLPPGDGARPTVEELIRLCRERSARHREFLAAKITAILTDAEPGADEAAIRSLVDLGPLAAPLLLAHLDLKEGGDGAVRGGRLAASALARFPATETRAPLLKILKEGTPTGRRLAAEVLGQIGGPEAAPALVESLGQPDPGLRRAAVVALGRLREAQASGRIAALLSGADPDLAAEILAALRAIASPDALPAVAAFLETPSATPLLGEALDYVVVVRGRAALPMILKRLASGTATVGQTIRLLQAAGSVAPPADRETLAALREYLDENRVKNWDVRAEAAFALAALGDEAGAKGLLREYQAWIQKNSKLPGPYAGRGGVYLRLGKWREALADFQEAIRLSKGDPVDPKWYVDAARALCRLGRPREAVTFLQRSGLNAKGLARYRDLPEFEELRKNEKYRSVWEG